MPKEKTSRQTDKPRTSLVLTDKIKEDVRLLAFKRNEKKSETYRYLIVKSLYSK